MPSVRRALTALVSLSFAVLAVLCADGAAGTGEAQAAELRVASVVGEPPQGHGVFRFPQAVALSSGGTRVYVGDQYSGIVQVFDGSGAWLRDIGSRAARAEDGRLGVVGGVAVDQSGHLFVLDAENDRVQIFDAVSGAHLRSVGDRTLFDLMSGTPSSGAGIVASGLAVFQASAGAAITVYVADSGNDRIERLTLDAGTLAPTGDPAISPASLGLQNPQGLTLSADGSRLYVADDGSHRIVMLDAASFALLGQAGSLGGAPGSDAEHFFPYDVAVDGSTPPKLYVADNLAGRVQLFDATSLGFLGTFGHHGYGPGVGNLEIVRAVHAQQDAGPGVAVTDTANNRIQRLDGSGNVTAAWGLAGRSFGYVSRPRDVTFTPAGGIAVADTFAQRVALYDADGTQVDQRGLVSAGIGYAVPGNAPGQFELPSGVTFTADGSLWISDTANDRVVRENSDGSVAAVTAQGAVDDPRGLAPSPNGVYVASRGSDSVIEVHPDGSTTVVMTGLGNPVAIATTPDGGSSYVADDHRIRHIPDGATVTSPTGTPAGWDHPAGLALDRSGALYVSEQRPGTADGARVLQGTPQAGLDDWQTIAAEGAGEGAVIEPAGLAVSADGGTLLIADSGNNRVLRLDAPGITAPALHRVDVSIDQFSRGTVTSDLPGIACVTDCTQGYGGGRTITLTAQAKPGQRFLGWGDDCAAAGTTATCALAMTSDRRVAAHFDAVPAPAPTPLPAPKLTAATITPHTLHRARRASARHHRKARRATRAKVRISLSRAAPVELTLLQGRAGRKSRGAHATCRPVSRRLRGRPHCTRFVALRGSRTLAAATTLKSTLTPNWHGRALAPGKYRLVIGVPGYDGRNWAELVRAFTVVR
ncbi:MAG: NHL repeat-containing protein [Patulibacter sp.]